MRRGYQKIFMPVDGKFGGIDDRLTEVEKTKELVVLDAVCSMVQSIRDSFEQGRHGICKFRHWSCSSSSS
ncbi:hypothetical protein MKX03_017660 [Papaver bracteatum]|nr:hypothetical protein MKX03_017660 [Papaver bracteatum]